jgi:hypothetical protein
MEFNFDADTQDIKEVEVFLVGWKPPIIIQYGIKELGFSSAWEMCWKVKGTQHIFRIALNELYQDCQDNYEEHFSKVLAIFRKDYLEWYKQGFTTDWMQNYNQQFSRFIYTFD